jgi:hypothetical protein
LVFTVRGKVYPGVTIFYATGNKEIARPERTTKMLGVIFSCAVGGMSKTRKPDNSDFRLSFLQRLIDVPFGKTDLGPAANALVEKIGSAIGILYGPTSAIGQARRMLVFKTGAINRSTIPPILYWT